MNITDFFELVETEEKTHKWTFACHDGELSPVDELARVLAIKIMEHRLRPQHFQAWESRLNGGEPLPEKIKATILAFTKPAFGNPGEPDSINIEHLEGLVSQYLWYFVCKEISNETIVREIPPGFKSTDPGGDALMIHRLGDGHLRFRLWEIKKLVRRNEDATATTNSTITRAYEQIRSNALEYLARYTSIGQELEPELNDFFGNLVEMWLDATPEASAGVAINTSEACVASNSFHDFGEKFPEFVNPVRLLGIIAAVEDFALLTSKVREFVWKGL
jgi:hypothetical protein